MKRLLLVSLLVACVFCRDVDAQPKWFVYSAPDNSFSVELPWKPIYERRNFSNFLPGIRQRMETFKGTQYQEFYNLRMYPDESSTRFYINVYELAKKRSDTEFDDEVDSLMSSLSDKDKHFPKNESVSINGFHGREYIYEKGKASGRVLIINAGNRIYLLRFHTENKKGISRSPVEKVFNTFQLKS